MDVVQDRQQQQADRLGEVEAIAHDPVFQDVLRRSDVGFDDRAGRVVREQRPAVHEHHRVVVHIDHPARRIHVMRDLVHIRVGGQARADIEKLTDATVCGQISHRSAQKRPARTTRLAGVRHDGQRTLGHHPVDSEVVLAADHEVVYPGHVWLRDVDTPGCHHVVGHSRPSLVGDAGRSQLTGRHRIRRHHRHLVTGRQSRHR
jgi:hypothetical protein